jgi:secondary thiamine-phosphate synthase enzyme
MKFHTDYLTIDTAERYEIRDITPDVARIVADAAIEDGIALVSAMHITASVFVNDREPGLYSDIATWLEELAPAKPDYLHHRTGEDNADAHLKRMLLGHQVTLPITREARSRPVGARALRRVRRPASEADRGQGDGRIDPA